MTDRCLRCLAELAPAANYCARCGALASAPALADASDTMIGQVVLGRYSVVRRLGEGGMGRVYLAEQSMGQATRPVALKALRKELISDPKISGRFLRESEIVIRLAHPNTIQFYDFGQLDDGTLVIVMEYIEGRTLAEELRREPLPLARVDALMKQICGSVAEAHAHGIVHRDLKPQNILLTTRAGHSDFVKVVDFGIALRRGEEDQDATRFTTQGTLIGTPPYMSPEQFQDRDIDPRSDVYSLGVMLYEMLAGELPFGAKSAWQWAAAHLEQAPKPIAEHERGRQLPPARVRAVMRALEKDPEKRPRNAGELLREWLGASDAQDSSALPGDSRPADAHRAGAHSPTDPEVFVAKTLRAPLPATRSKTAWPSWLPLALLVGAGLTLSWRGGKLQLDDPALETRSKLRAEPVQRTTKAKRARTQERRAAGERKQTRNAELSRTSAVAAADHAAAGDVASLDGTSNVEAALAAARSALEDGALAGAADALQRARTLQPEHPELPLLRARFSEAAARNTVELGAGNDCSALLVLASAMARAEVTRPTELEHALSTCSGSANSPGDAGPNSASIR